MKTFLKIFVFLLILVGLCMFAFYKTPQERLFEKTFASASAGDTQAAYQLARMYAQGQGTAADGNQAAEWYRKAAADGNMQAAWELADLYIQGQLITQNLEEAAVYLQAAARGGNMDAQKELARFYQQGLGGLPAQPGEALFWQIKAGEAGDEEAQTAVQDVQLENPQLYEDVTRFIELLKSAQNGNSQAQLEVGQGLQAGVPLAQNEEEAFRWFTRAWQEGDKLPQAAYELSQLYQNGAGVEKDEAKAMELLGAAAQAKNPDAQYMLGTMAYGVNPPKYEDAFAWFSNAAAGGQAQGQYMTGFMLMQGQGTPKSVPLAIEFFRKAAEQNHTAAQYVLGQIYWKGLGVAVNKKEGEQWLRRAADGGNEAARQLLENH